MSNVGVIQEQGDYGNFSPLNQKDRRSLEEQRTKAGSNKSSWNGEQIRLGDCGHLDR